MHEKDKGEAWTSKSDRCCKDWDILVLLDKEKITADDHENISYSLYDLGLDYQELVNTVLFTKKDWQDNRTAIFRHNVLEDAIPL